jgi:hypothetical protein
MLHARQRGRASLVQRGLAGGRFSRLDGNVGR